MQTINMTETGEKIRAIRQKREMSQSAIAALITSATVSKSFISELERGVLKQTPANIEHCKELAAALRTRLIYEKDETEAEPKNVNGKYVNGHDDAPSPKPNLMDELAAEALAGPAAGPDKAYGPISFPIRKDVLPPMDLESVSLIACLEALRRIEDEPRQRVLGYLQSKFPAKAAA